VKFKFYPAGNGGARLPLHHFIAMSEDCLFCKILKGQIPSQKVQEDDSVYAFRDINPQAPMHVLVIPKEHIPSLNELEPKHDALMGHVARVAAEIAKKEGHGEKGYRLAFNCQSGAGQTVFHLHAHVLGGRRFAWPPG
jgi:histidine triad (HIT) family protein